VTGYFWFVALAPCRSQKRSQLASKPCLHVRSLPEMKQAGFEVTQNRPEIKSD
jgi:hypothetical protein